VSQQVPVTTSDVVDMRSSHLAAIYQGVLRPIKTSSFPVSEVRVHVCIRVFPDVLRCWVAWRITGHEIIVVLLVLVLVNSDEVDGHQRREILLDGGNVNGSETVGHAGVGDDGHWLLWNDSLADVAVGSGSGSLH